MTQNQDKIRQLLDKHKLMTGADLRKKHDEAGECIQKGEFDIQHIIQGEAIWVKFGHKQLLSTLFYGEKI